MVILNYSCFLVCLFKGQVHTIKFDIPLILAPPALHSFAPFFLNNSTEPRVWLNHTTLRINSASRTGLTYAHRILHWLLSSLKLKAKKVPIAQLWQGCASQKDRRLYRTPALASLPPPQYVLHRPYCNTLDF